MKKLLLALWIWFILVTPIRSQEPIYLPLITKGNCMGIAKLAISDGTTEISLLDLEGIHLAEGGWTPKIIQAKSGGVFQDSSMAAGRRLVYRQLGTAREDFTFNIMGIDQDELIAETSDLLQMLEKAVNYWVTDWQSTLVYLIARGDCETYARYAPILYYEAPELQNPYAQPFIQNEEGAIFDDIGIMIEHGHWQDVVPGSSTCTEASTLVGWAFQDAFAVNTVLPVDYVNAIVQTSNGYIYATDQGALPGLVARIIRTTDGGTIWAQNTLLTPGAVGDLLFQAANDYIYAGDSGGGGQLLRSVDNGASWQVNTVLPSGEPQAMIQASNGNLLLASAGAQEILLSTDNGASWIVATTDVVEDITGFAETNTGDILAVDSGKQILVSSDSGVTWSERGAPPEMTSFISGAAIIADDGSILTSTQNEMIRSGDDGFTWNIVYEPAGAFKLTGELVKDHNGYLYSMDNNGTFIRSVDNGLTWNTFESIAGVTFTSLATALYSGNYYLYAGELGNIYRRDESGFSVGRGATCLNENYSANKTNTSNISHIKIDDGGVFSDIGLPMSLPDDLLPAVPVVNDAIYFGVNTGLTNVDTGPFSSLVFDLSQGAWVSNPSVNNFTITWEYWNGAWVALTVTDNTAAATALMRPGVNSVHWVQPTDWTTTAVDGITGYWIRARVSALTGGAITPPEQQNRDIYSITNGYIDVDASQVLGDISSLARVLSYNESDEDGPGGSGPDLYENRLLAGLRSYDRGDNFQAYINISDEQNPVGITITAGTNTTIGADVSAPSGRSATYNPAGVEAMATRVSITLATTIARDFYGSYHMFLRVQRTAGASTDFNVQLVFVTGSGGIQKTTESKQVQTTTAFELLDFGQVTIPVGGSLASSDLGDQIQILIQASAASGTPNLVLYDLILIPVDEWAIDSVDQTNSSTSDIGRSSDISKLLDIDSVTDPKNPIKSIVRQVGSDLVTANYNPITNGPAILQSNTDQRLWFLAAQTSATGSSYNWISPPEICHSIQLYKAQRYLGLRGNR